MMVHHSYVQFASDGQEYPSLLTMSPQLPNTGAKGYLFRVKKKKNEIGHSASCTI